MSGHPQPYVRVYYSILDDEKFQDVYDDDRALATWLRLLIQADAMYPAAAPVPANTSAEVLAMLTEAGIIERIGTTRYRVHGLASERERRTNKGKQMASARWSTSNADSDAASMLASNASADAETCATSRDETKRDETSRAQPAPALPDEEPDVLDAWYRLTASWPSQKIIPWLNQLAADHGAALVIEAIATEWISDPDRATVIGRARDRLEKSAHDRKKEREKAAAAARAAEQKKQAEQMSPEKLAENRERLRKAIVDAGLISTGGDK